MSATPLGQSAASLNLGGGIGGGGGSNTSAASPSRHHTIHASIRSDASTTSSVTNARNKANFLRNLLGQRRNNDYRTDAAAGGVHHLQRHSNNDGSSSSPSLPAPPRSGNFLSRVVSQRTVVSARGNNGPEAMAEGRGGAVLWTSCCLPSERRKQIATAILHDQWYRAMMWFFTFVLLFGAQIQVLWIPSGAGDVAMDVLFQIVFVVFCVDIMMRIDVEPQYFSLNVCCHRTDAMLLDPNATETTSWFTWSNCQVGSFLFWCEFASTLALLVEISYINSRKFEEKTYNIELNAFGIPVSGLGDLDQATPVEHDLYMIAVIAKTARVVRFIQSSTAVKISSKINWYWFCNVLNPYMWCGRTGRDHTGRPNGATGGLRSSRRLSGSAEEGSGNTGRGGSMDAGGVSGNRDLVRKNSWGGLGLGALAAVKSQQQGQEAERRKPHVRLYRLVLRRLGIGGYDNDEWRRHVAATKIQRAWRSCVAQRQHEYTISESSHFDVAWNGGWRRNNNSAEMALKKRSSIMHNTGKGGTARDIADILARSRALRAVQRKNESQVGSKMRELTGQRVAIGIIVVLMLTVLFSYVESDATRQASMIVLHNQTGYEEFAGRALAAARRSAVPDLYLYQFSNGSYTSFDVPEASNELRARETLRITVAGPYGQTMGLFAYRDEVKEAAVVQLLSTIFILLVWFFGVTAFAGPVMILVVVPIERMVRLLGMLMLDPLGYQGSIQYKRFVAEEDEITKNTRWTKEVLKGMETSFLMSTILRIGSLMKVGFGSAGVEIIRNNLEKGQSKNMLILSEKGSTVSCIFLFCDIRQFTDATECLQEEVFVFTNRIAAVVHSICHSFGGSANKNIGDAFLLSWLLDDDPSSGGFDSSASETFVAKNNQADKALLSVVKICIALHHDDYYIQTMTDGAREALLTKLSKRKGPVVQMGFGLHAGKAVQGAIGSQRKIDATYVSEAVERAEFLESSTKTYGVKMLMSDSFHRLLHPSNRRRCRKVDQILIRNDEDESDEDYMNGDIVELLTFDMDIDALWKNPSTNMKGAKTGRVGGGKSESGHESDSESAEGKPKREMLRMPNSIRQGGSGMLKAGRRRSARLAKDESSDLSDGVQGTPGNSQADLFDGDIVGPGPSELVLPTGPAMYNANVWVNDDMRKIRQLYSDGLFFQKFNSGLPGILQQRL